MNDKIRRNPNISDLLDTNPDQPHDEWQLVVGQGTKQLVCDCLWSSPPPEVVIDTTIVSNNDTERSSLRDEEKSLNAVTKKSRRCGPRKPLKITSLTMMKKTGYEQNKTSNLELGLTKQLDDG